LLYLAVSMGTVQQLSGPPSRPERTRVLRKQFDEAVRRSYHVLRTLCVAHRYVMANHGYVSLSRFRSELPGRPWKSVNQFIPIQPEQEEHAGPDPGHLPGFGLWYCVDRFPDIVLGNARQITRV